MFASSSFRSWILLSGVLAACAGGESLNDKPPDDATRGAGGSSPGVGRDGNAGSGGQAGWGGGSSGWGGVGAGWGGSGPVDGDAGNAGTRGVDAHEGSAGTGGADTGTGGARVDASAGGGGFSGTSIRDASFDVAEAVDSAGADQAIDAGDTEGGEGDGGTCGPVFCFDVFECWIAFPTCGYTACELFTCKK